MQIDIIRKNYTVPNCNYLAIIPAANDDKRFKQGVLTRDRMQIDITRKNYTVPKL